MPHAGPHLSSRTWMVVTFAIVASMVVPLGLLATPADAAGSSSTLGSFILSSPEPGWPQDSPGVVQAIVDRLEKIDSNAVNGEAVPVAAKVWHSSADDEILAITLSQWPANAGGLDNLARVALNDECVAVSGNDPTSIGSVPNLSGSLATTCAASDGSATLVVADAPKGNDLEMIESIGIRGGPTLDPAAVARIASTQFDALPAAPANAAGIVDGIVGTAVTIAAAVGAVVLGRRAVRRRRRRRLGTPTGAPVFSSLYSDEWGSASTWPGATAAPSSAGGAPALRTHAGYAPPGAVAAPAGSEPASSLPPLGAFLAPPSPPPLGPSVGWHPEGDSQTVQRYWDGTAWTNRIRWDGSAWVREPRASSSL